MKTLISVLAALVLPLIFPSNRANAAEQPIGTPGAYADYAIELDSPAASTVARFSVRLGATVEEDGIRRQWYHLEALKQSGDEVNIWLLSEVQSRHSMRNREKRVFFGHWSV